MLNGRTVSIDYKTRFDGVILNSLEEAALFKEHDNIIILRPATLQESRPFDFYSFARTVIFLPFKSFKMIYDDTPHSFKEQTIISYINHDDIEFQCNIVLTFPTEIRLLQEGETEGDIRTFVLGYEHIYAY